MRPAEWVAYGTESNDVAAATKAAAAGKRHTAMRIFASYDDPEVSGVLTLKDGNSTLATFDVHGSRELDVCYRGGLGNALSAELAAGGAGVDGSVTIVGYTEG